MDIDDTRVSLFFIVFLLRLFFFLLFLFLLGFFLFLLGLFFLLLSRFLFSLFLKRRYLIRRNDLVAALISRILHSAFLRKKVLEFCGENKRDPGLAFVDGDDLVLSEQFQQIFGEGDLIASAANVTAFDRVLVRDHISQYRQIASFSCKSGVRLEVLADPDHGDLPGLSLGSRHNSFLVQTNALFGGVHIADRDPADSPGIVTSLRVIINIYFGCRFCRVN